MWFYSNKGNSVPDVLGVQPRQEYHLQSFQHYKIPLDIDLSAFCYIISFILLRQDFMNIYGFLWREKQCFILLLFKNLYGSSLTEQYHFIVRGNASSDGYV